jgi:hypothetical protein
MRHIKNTIKALSSLTLLIFYILFLSAPAFAATPPSSTIDNFGTIDTITLDGINITAEGWATPAPKDDEWTEIQVKLEQIIVYRGSFEVISRPDVAKHFQQPEWLLSGWKIAFELPKTVSSGAHPIEIDIRSQSGRWMKIGNSPTSKTLTIDRAHFEQLRNGLKIKIWIAGATIFLAMVFLKAKPITFWINQKVRLTLAESLLFSTAILLVFFLFVGLGLTGSSLPLGLQATPSTQADMTNVFAPNRPIRGDEWSVVTPSAIAQYNHAPRYPVLNRNLGEDGQNMLIVGLSGVPVAHLSSLSKPATWGFFVFDLKRALAWYWWFPVFGCFLALAFTLHILSPENWRKSFLFSALLIISPNSVAWSNWPAYVVFFPCMMFLSAFQIAKTSNRLALLAWGFILGLSIAGFVFILFPSLQVSVGYIFIALTVGVILRDRLYKEITRSRTLAYAVSLAVAGVILGSWWIDARDAIHIMSNTVYPGHRISAGGGMSMAMLLRGFTNISTLEQMNSTVSNQSEIASFYLLLLPLLALFLLRLMQNVITALEWSLALVICFTLFYIFIGLPESLSNLLLWGRVPLNRADLALGLACLMLTHLLMGRRSLTIKTNTLTKFIAISVALAWSFIVYHSLTDLPASLFADIDIKTLIITLTVTAATSYYLITNQATIFLLLSLGLSLASTIHFNPINTAPTLLSTRLPSGLENQVNGPINTRVLVMESFVTPMILAASGVPVVNGTFYYPQQTLWSHLDPSGRQLDIYNRYQRLIFTGNDSVESHSLEAPSPDIVRVNINLKHFDFNKSGANLLLAPEQETLQLNANNSLSFITSTNGWSWFNIVKN